MTLIFSSIFNSFSKENSTLCVVDQGSSRKSSRLSRMVLASSACSADLNSTNSWCHDKLLKDKLLKDKLRKDKLLKDKLLTRQTPENTNS